MALELPAQISPSGKRERHLFEEHSEALTEANKVRQTFPDFGRIIKMLSANRLVEAIECWDPLDESGAGVSGVQDRCDESSCGSGRTFLEEVEQRSGA